MREPGLCFVDTMDTAGSSPLTPHADVGGEADPPAATGTDAAASGVTALYQDHAVGLIRLAIVMLGDRAAAEDAVHDSFLGLYRHWANLRDPDKALAYARSAVLNQCRKVLRDRGRPPRFELVSEECESAEATMLVGVEHQRVLEALRALPDRQRETLALRYYLDMSEEDTARAMNVSRGTVKSATHRGVVALARILKEDA